jgi:PAS domain S-box-containing protein
MLSTLIPVTLDPKVFKRHLLHALFWPAFSIGVVAIALTVMVSHLTKAAAAADHSNEVLASAHRCEKLAVDMETGLRGFQITRDKAFLEPYKTAQAALPGEIAGLATLVADNPAQREQVTNILLAQKQWDKFAADILERATQGGDYLSSFTNLTGKHLMDGTRQEFYKLEKNEEDLREYRTKNMREIRASVVPISSGLLFLVLAVISYVSWRRMTELSRSYQKALVSVAEQRAWYEVTLSSIGDAVIATDIHGKVTFLNGVAEEMTGWKLLEARGQPLETVFNIIHEGTRAKAENPVARALREGVVVGLANHTALIAKDGREISIEDSAAPIRDASKKCIGAIMVFHDVTERRRSIAALHDRARLAALRADINDALIKEDSIGAIFQKCAEAMVTHLDAAFARIWTLNNEGTVLELKASAGLYTHLDGPHSRVPLGEFKIGRIAQLRQPLVTNDVQHDPNIGDPEWARREGMVSFAGYPLVLEGQLLGVMALFARHPLPSPVRKDLALIAGGISQWIRRKRSEEQLHDTQARLDATLAAAEVATWTWDVQNDRITADNNFVRLLSITPEEAAGGSFANWLRAVHPSDRQRVDDLIKNALKSGAMETEFRVLLPDSSVRWVVARGVVEYDIGGKPIRFPGVLIDITARKASELLEAAQKQVMELIAQDAPLGQVCEVLARTVEEQSKRGAIVSILLMDEDGVHLRHGAAPNLPEAYNRAIDGVAIGPRVGSCGTAAFTKKPVYVSDIAHDPLWADFAALAEAHHLRACWSIPILSGSGEVLGTFALYYREVREPHANELRMVEITTRTAAIAIERQRTAARLRASEESYRNQLEALVKERTAKLEETIGELEAFSYSISHDMRSPLRAMEGYARVLLDDYGKLLDDSGRHYLDRIRKASNRLDSLIQDVLAYSRVAKGDVDLHPVDLGKLIDEILPLHPEFQPPRAEITVQKPLPRVLGHEAYLTQCVTNFLGNAVRFMADGQLPRIQIRTEALNGKVRVWFEDNGIGIDPAHFERIFQIFGQVYKQDKYGGTGIGLAIVRKAVIRMDGEVGVESELGKGSRFWIQLDAA